MAAASLAGCRPLDMEPSDYLEEAYCILALVAFDLDPGRDGSATDPVRASAIRGATSLIGLAYDRLVRRGA